MSRYPSALKLSPSVCLHLLCLLLLLTDCSSSVPKKDPGLPEPPTRLNTTQGENGVSENATTLQLTLEGTQDDPSISDTLKDSVVSSTPFDQSAGGNHPFTAPPSNQQPVLPEQQHPSPETVPQLTVPQPAVPQPTVPQPAVPEPAVPQPTAPQPAVPEPAVPPPAVPLPSTTTGSPPQAAHTGPITSTGTSTSITTEPVGNVFTTTLLVTSTTTTTPTSTTTTSTAAATTSTTTTTTTSTAAAATSTTTTTTTSTAAATTSTTTTTSTATRSSTAAAHPATTVKATTTLTRANTTVAIPPPPPPPPTTTPQPNAPPTWMPPIQTSLPKGPTTTAVASTSTPADRNEPVASGTRVSLVDEAGSALTRQLVDTASLLAVLLFGLLFFLVTVALFVTQAYESYRRKDYTQVDYLINGMYTDSGV